MNREPARPLRVLIVDDHEIVREGLVAVLARQPGMEVIAQAGTATEALAATIRHVPDVVILDISLPDGSGIETCREIKARYPTTKVIILTGSGDEDTALAAVIAGANGYLLKQSGIRDVLRGIEVVSSGGSLLDPIATDRIVRRIRHLNDSSASDPFSGFTPREHQILELIAAGRTNKEIAAQLQLSEKTIKRSVSTILSKLNLERRAQAAALYVGRRTAD